MAKSAQATFEVTRSFGTLNEGDRFEAEPGDPWVKAHVEAGLLKEVPGANQRSGEARQG